MEQRVVYCQDLLLMGQDERFWENIIACEGTYCFAYDPATKRQSSEWMGQNPRTRGTATSKTAS
jgi:hypothetical protein